MCFPPNLTHILQPLDALYFGYLKKEIRKNLPKFHITKKWDVLAALKSPFYHASEESIIKNSFKKLEFILQNILMVLFFKVQ